MLRPLALALMSLFAGCGSGNANATQCQGDRTLLDGVCVSQQVADYVACVRAQGARLGEERSRKLSAEAGFAGTHASVADDVSDHLQREYSASDANTLEIIKACGQMSQAGEDVCGRAGSALVSCGYQNDPAWLGTCQKSPAYQGCLRAAGTDCSALSICGIAQWCGGTQVGSGTATCEQTGSCTHECHGDAACTCRCFAGMSRTSALSTGIVSQCFNLKCSQCGTNGSPSCDGCFHTDCGTTWDSWCKGH